MSGLLLAGVLGCAHAPAAAAPQAYADALARGDLDQAYALTSAAYRSHVSATEFAARNADPDQRQEKANRIRAVESQLGAVAPELAAEPDARIAGARAALNAFLSAADARRFSAAYEWLSSDLRARYTPASLARDFSLAPDAGDRLRRAWAAASGPAIAEGARVRFPIAQGRAVELVEEADGFRVAALE